MVQTLNLLFCPNAGQPSLEQSEKWDPFFVMPVNSLVVDSTFEQSQGVFMYTEGLKWDTYLFRCGLYTK